jgi:DNA-binding PadR family transcriptional regulator
MRVQAAGALATIPTAMPPSRSADLSARILVLGIVVQEGGPLTLANVGLRLEEDFGATQYSPNAVHQNLRNLTKGGYLRLVEEGTAPSFNVYEAVQKGVQEFEEWLNASEPDPPALRDAMQARLNFYTRRAEQGDIAGLVERVQQQHKRCARRFAIAHGEVRLEQDHQDEQERAKPGSVTLSESLRLIRLEDEADLWGKMSQRFRKLQGRLETLLAKASGGG